MDMYDYTQHKEIPYKFSHKEFLYCEISAMSTSDWNSWTYSDPSCPKANLLYGQVGNFHMAISDNQDLSIKNFVP